MAAFCMLKLNVGSISRGVLFMAPLPAAAWSSVVVFQAPDETFSPYTDYMRRDYELLYSSK